MDMYLRFDECETNIKQDTNVKNTFELIFFVIVARFLNDAHHPLDKDMAFYLIHDILV